MSSNKAIQLLTSNKSEYNWFVLESGGPVQKGRQVNIMVAFYKKSERSNAEKEFGQQYIKRLVHSSLANKITD